jgi:hypothetical protein
LVWAVDIGVQISDEGISLYIGSFCPAMKSLSRYRTPNVIRVIKSRRLRWAGHVDRMEEGRSVLKILTGKPTFGEA